MFSLVSRTRAGQDPRRCLRTVTPPRSRDPPSPSFTGSEDGTPGGSWSGWSQFDRTISNVAVARNRDGRLELFAVATLGEV